MTVAIVGMLFATGIVLLCVAAFEAGISVGKARSQEEIRHARIVDFSTPQLIDELDHRGWISQRWDHGPRSADRSLRVIEHDD